MSKALIVRQRRTLALARTRSRTGAIRKISKSPVAFALPWYGQTTRARSRSRSPALRQNMNGVSDYDRILRANTRSNGTKLRDYAKKWLGVPVGFITQHTYKKLLLKIHPNRGNRSNTVNQAKRTALIRLLYGLKP